MHSPAAALLWESWRITRLEILLRISFALAIGLLAFGASLLVVEKADTFATIALLFLVVLGAMSGKGLNEFPFSLGFVRPIPTWMLVVVPMLFISFSSAMVYLIPVMLLKSLTDIPYPDLSAAALIGLAALIFAASSWWSRRRVARVATQYLLFVGGFILYESLHLENVAGNDFPPSRWANMFDFSLADYGLFAFIAIVALSFTLVGVENQRRGGDSRLSHRDSSGRVSAFFRILTLQSDTFVTAKCPPGSPLQAQIWFEVKTVSWEVISIGFVTALAIPLCFALIAFFDLSPGLVFLVVFASPVFPLLVGLSIVFPVQMTQSRLSMSSFDATFPMRTVGLVGLKVTNVLVSILVAVVGLYTSMWLSFDLVVGVDENLTLVKSMLVDFYQARSGTRLVVLGVFGISLLATLIACLLSVRMFALLYMWRVVSVFLGGFAYLIIFLLANANGLISFALVQIHIWAVIVVLVSAMFAVYYRAWLDWTLSPLNFAYAGVLILAYLSVHVAFLTGLDENLASSGAVHYLLLALAAVPVTAIALAPWSVDLLRHR